MRICFLGPLVLLGDPDGGPLALPPPAERSLLVRLALSAGHLVPAETLIDDLWRDRAPRDPVNALQIRLSKLRRALTALGLPDDLIVTRSPGYILRIDPADVDAHRFTTLVADARHSAVRSPAQAVHRYEEALALWRGPALAEFAEEPWARPEAVRLEELRLTATEERVDVVLETGESTVFADLVGELESLTAEHPLRERLRGQLMRALYGAGRQADALDVYQRTRAELRGELGLEPSIELRNLEEAILRQDPGLRTSPGRHAEETGNLPVRLSSVIGREKEVKRVQDLLGEHRLVTLLGPGGVGKTTLALEAARTLDTCCADGVWLVELASVDDGNRVPDTVADALGVPHGDEGVEEQLTRCLRNREMLIVLDNCEQVVDACAWLTRDLLSSCPGVRVLATSREPLGMTGEACFAVSPLRAPPENASAGEVPEYDAVRLFVDRARGFRPDFDPAGGDMLSIARICRALDGIPLSLELAAAWIRSLSLGEIDTRLADRFDFLVMGPRTAAARQRTLRAAADWSYRLLDEPEQVLFRRLSVFRGGFSLRAVEDICSGGSVPSQGVPALLTQLVDRSLVVPEDGPEARYRLLETLFHYAGLRQRERGAAEARDLADAHAAHYLGAAERAAVELRGPGQNTWLGWLTRERDNLQHAFGHCRSHEAEDPDRALRMAAALGWLWYFAGRRGGGAEIASVVHSAVTGSPRARGRALQARALAERSDTCLVHPDVSCARVVAESLDLLTEAGDDHGAAYSRVLLAVEGIRNEQTTPYLKLLGEAVEAFTEHRDRWGNALAAFVEMELRFTLGTLDAGVATGERALADFRGLGDHRSASAIHYHLGVALQQAGRLKAALASYEGALREGHTAGLANVVQYSLARIGILFLDMDDPETADRRFEESHAVARTLGADGNALAALGQAAGARQQGRLGAALAHGDRALRLLDGLNRPEWVSATHTCMGHAAELSGDLDAALVHHTRALAAARLHPRSVALPTALEGMACVCAVRGDAEGAASLLGAAARRRERLRIPPSPQDTQDIERATARARGALGEDAYRHAHARGYTTGQPLREHPAPPPNDDD
ncbi:BTAD domain-containing putative transcriptional regulator [Streptomyces heilongjiangensis]|uniref:BTAD domain-containing putative transcriptional regulator n=1 Tax=Streptomyces heilongjiangensis TaxID=945052 RepID=A0ABW1AYP5_9ACTN|nr:BTAD domain-containing putative transcriptional regulator [Streptomyces heilongjiangensis]MDC2947924.1 BTAD domain-containing putative transcriptional regulator [Streptomyces heilongjiangensis]